MDDRTERFRRLFDSCYGPVWAYARRRVEHGDVDDVVADVFTTAWRRLDDVPAGRELPWLYGVARRTVANRRRGSERRRRLATRLGAERPHATDEGGDRDVVVAGALARLRPDDREILRLAAWEQLTAADLAVVLGCTVNAANLRLSRARRRFRDALTGMVADRTPGERKVTDA